MLSLEVFIRLYCMLQNVCVFFYNAFNEPVVDFIISMFPENSFVTTLLESLVSYIPLLSNVTVWNFTLGSSLVIVIVLHFIKFIGDVLPT